MPEGSERGEQGMLEWWNDGNWEIVPNIIRARFAFVFAKASTRQAAQSRKRVPSFQYSRIPLFEQRLR